MDAREQRGLVIAALCKLKKQGDEWLVPSQSDVERVYRVNLTTKTCSCKDHLEGGFHCKHLRAVAVVLKRETNVDGTMIETKSITIVEKIYQQNWPAYNAAQSIEKDRFQELLFDICRNIQSPDRVGAGRKPHTYRDSLFAMVFKVYTTISSRRFSSDLREAYERDHLSTSIPGMKIPQFFENPAFTPILKELITKSALPLRAVETDFAIDSSGFSSGKFERFIDHKHGVTRFKHAWVKVHLACGVKTNIVTAVRILDKDAADCPQFIPLVKDTRKGFVIGECSADKAYLSLENFEAVANCGGQAFIAFKKNSTGGVGGVFEKMFHYFQFRQEEFMQHYHKRSNVESTFSMIKRKFGDAVRSKTETAMVNEVLSKILCHNLCVLIQENHELGIEIGFKPTASVVVAVKPVQAIAAPVLNDFDYGDFRFSD
jgi:transposase